MSAPVLAPRESTSGLWATVGFAAVFAIVVVLTASSDRDVWFLIGAGLTLLVAFGANMLGSPGPGFIVRTAASALAGVFALGVIALGAALTQIAAPHALGV